MVARLWPTLYFLWALGVPDLSHRADLLSFSAEDKLLPRIEFLESLGLPYHTARSMARRRGGPPASAAVAAAPVPACVPLGSLALSRDCKGDYIGVPNDPCLTKILSKRVKDFFSEELPMSYGDMYKNFTGFIETINSSASCKLDGKDADVEKKTDVKRSSSLHSSDNASMRTTEPSRYRLLDRLTIAQHNGSVKQLSKDFFQKIVSPTRALIRDI